MTVIPIYDPRFEYFLGSKSFENNDFIFNELIKHLSWHHIETSQIN